MMSDIARTCIGGPFNGRLMATQDDYPLEAILDDGFKRVRYLQQDFAVRGNQFLPDGIYPLFTLNPLPPTQEIIDLLIKARA
jgi:hypothetical protein